MSVDVVVNDVGPRDGLQNQPGILTPGEREQLVRALYAAGLRHIEAGAFVSPKAVPAMANTDQVLAGLGDLEDALLTVLIPNLKGYELATAAGAKSVCMVLYASEAMAQANARMSREQAEAATEEIVRRARADRVRVTAVVAVAFECPFDGLVDPGVVRTTAARFLDLGVDELGVADTIGAANPRQVSQLMSALVGDHGAQRLSCHFHDTRAMALANVYAAVETGVRKFDSSIGGLGGCPFAPGAAGNLATEDVVMLLEQMGLRTGVSLEGLLEAAALADRLTGAVPGARAGAWLQRQYAKAESKQA